MTRPAAARTAFAARWDRRLALATATLAALLLGAAALTVWAAVAAAPSAAARTVGVLSAAVPLIVLVATAFHAPRRYVIGETHLRVERWVGPVEVPLAGIADAQLLREGQLDGAVRLLGVDGLFGYFGRFHHPALGGFRLYGTRREGAVLVRTHEGPIVVTPDDPGAFVAALRTR